MSVTILTGDCRDVLSQLKPESVHCVVTSPPYFGLRDYGTAKWEGGEPSCNHSPEKRGGRFATPVSAKQASNTGSGTISQRECPCGVIELNRDYAEMAERRIKGDAPLFADISSGSASMAEAAE